MIEKTILNIWNNLLLKNIKIKNHIRQFTFATITDISENLNVSDSSQFALFTIIYLAYMGKDKIEQKYYTEIYDLVYHIIDNKQKFINYGGYYFMSWGCIEPISRYSICDMISYINNLNSIYDDKLKLYIALSNLDDYL